MNETPAVDIIETVNRGILKAFKQLQKEKTNLYTTATKNRFLTSINDKSMIVYDNSEEIYFDGTFRLTRNKLTPLQDHELENSPEKVIGLSNFTHLSDFDKNITELQKFCYDSNVRINIAYINQSITQLLSVYKSFKLYKHNTLDEVILVFSIDHHKTYLLSKLV